MTYFKIVKAALDALVAGICKHRGVSPEAAMKMVAVHLGNMSEQWRNGENPTIAYGDPICRFAYLFCHTPVNANICEAFLRSHPETTNMLVSKLNGAGELKVCAFGGGPGTELLALVKMFRRLHADGRLTTQGDINFTLLDNTTEWAESWQALESAVRCEFVAEYGSRREWPFTTSKSFLSYDMTKLEQFANLQQLLEHDIYILNYVVSEIVENGDALGRLINLMTQHAKSGARFIIIDRNQEGILPRARLLLENAGLTIVHQLESSRNMDGDEQASDVQEYIDKINRRPRVQWRGAFCVIGVKP